MDSLTIGILIGVALMMLHQYISTAMVFRNRRKEMQDNHRRQIELFESYNRRLQQPTLEEQLQQALDAQNFEEAARIRNLMAKK